LETYLSKVRALENVAFQASGYFLWVRPQVVSLLLLLIDVRKREILVQIQTPRQIVISRKKEREESDFLWYSRCSALVRLLALLADYFYEGIQWRIREQESTLSSLKN